MRTYFYAYDPTDENTQKHRIVFWVDGDLDISIDDTDISICATIKGSRSRIDFPASYKIDVITG